MELCLIVFGRRRYGRIVRSAFVFLCPEAWPRTFALAGVSLEGLSWAFCAPGAEVLARRTRNVQATFIFSKFRTLDAWLLLLWECPIAG